MRLFPALYNNDSHNKIRHFQALWVGLRKRKVMLSPEKELLEAQGIEVLKPSDVLSEVIEKPKYEDFFPEPPPPPEPKETLHFMGPQFVPLLGQALTLAQNLTWSMTTAQLPKVVMDNKRELLAEDRQLVEQDILSAHLLDNWEEHIKDPRNFELPNKLETVYDNYTIPMYRKNELLSHNLIQTLDQTSLDPLSFLARPHLHQTSAKCSFRYKDSLVQLAMAVPLLVGAESPLPPVAPSIDSNLFIQQEVDDKTRRMILRKQVKADVGTELQQPMLGIEPLDAFIGAKQLDQYMDLPSQFVTTDPSFHLHTAHFHHNAELLHLQPHQLTSLSLLELFSLALTYAVQAGVKVNSSGHLKTPIVVQGVHSHLNLFQPAVFQLNTLGPFCRPVTRSSNKAFAHVSPVDALAGSNVRNVFYYQPFEKLYDECKYVVAKPTLSGVNAKLIATLRALHEM